MTRHQHPTHDTRHVRAMPAPCPVLSAPRHRSRAFRRHGRGSRRHRRPRPGVQRLDRRTGRGPVHGPRASRAAHRGLRLRGQGHHGPSSCLEAGHGARGARPAWADDVLALRRARRRLPLQRARRPLQRSRGPTDTIADLVSRVPLWGRCLGHPTAGHRPRRGGGQAALRPPRGRPPGAAACPDRRRRCRASQNHSHTSEADSIPRRRDRPTSTSTTASSRASEPGTDAGAFSVQYHPRSHARARMTPATSSAGCAALMHGPFNPPPSAGAR